MKYLLVDFGSTYTKLTAIDASNASIIGTTKAITTVDTNILDGYYAAKAQLDELIGEVSFDDIKACSSAAGGLKMIAIGLVKELTVEAAKRACLGAGGKVTQVFVNKLNDEEILEIKAANADIILLAGGTDGGDSECIISNAKKLVASKIDIPIIVAGNKVCYDELKTIFAEFDNVMFCKNVMPKVNVLEIDDAKEAIRKQFIEHIIEAKGINKVQDIVGEVVMPTPEAVLRAAKLLADGNSSEDGIGDLIIVDIGGATSDVYSVGDGAPTNANVVIKGLPESYVKRTVEGDLGMRYSILNVLENYGIDKFKALLPNNIDITLEAKKRFDDIKIIPTNDTEYVIENTIGYACCDISVLRHAGSIETVYTPLGKMFYQCGKDLTNFKVVIGTGGVIINSNNYQYILKGALKQTDQTLFLKPELANFYVDQNYILSAMGVLSTIDENLALKIMKNNILEGTNA